MRVLAYQYLETTKPPNLTDHRYSKTRLGEEVVDKGYPYWVYRSIGTINPESHVSVYSATNKNNLQSRYGFTWREIRSFSDKLFGIWGGETQVKDLKTDETLAIKRGYFSMKYGICPRGKGSFFMQKFLVKVLKPSPKKVAY